MAGHMDESTKRPLKVFLCHASGDKLVVHDLYQSLIAEGWIEPWLDEEKLLPGQDWRIAIEKAVEDSDVVIVCLSNASVSKEGFVQKELRYASDIALEKPEETIFLIPLRLEECNVPRGLRSLQRVDLFEDHGFAMLLRSLKSRADKIEVKPEGDDTDGEPPKPPIPTKPGPQPTDRRSCYIYIIFSLIALSVVALFRPEIQALFRPPTITASPPLTSTATMVTSLHTTPTSITTPTKTPSQCKLPGTSNVFIVDQYYKPKQYMGDTGDIRKVAGGTPNPIQFEYITNGEGPHEWEYKYINMESNLNPAQFVGIMFIDSAGPGGTDPNNGYDLRGYKLIKWEARSIQGSVNVEFVIGGVTWNWDEQTKKMISAPYPDSIKSPISLLKPMLTPQWQEFEFVFRNEVEEEFLKCVVGVFGWVITWGDNGVKSIRNTDGIIIPENPKIFGIEIRNIRYEK